MLNKVEKLARCNTRTKATFLRACLKNHSRNLQKALFKYTLVLYA